MIIAFARSSDSSIFEVASYMDGYGKSGLFWQVIDILEKPDLKGLRADSKGKDLVLTDVSFGYTDEEEVLHGISIDNGLASMLRQPIRLR